MWVEQTERSSMKTTIEINDALFDRAKQLATQRQTTLRAVVESALRQFLDLHGSGRQNAFRLRRHSFRGRGLQAGLREQDWAAIRERAYEGRGG
jgi:predicted transcriptional regulator